MALSLKERRQLREDAKKQKALEKEAKKQGLTVDELLDKENPTTDTEVEPVENTESEVVEETPEQPVEENNEATLENAETEPEESLGQDDLDWSTPLDSEEEKVEPVEENAEALQTEENGEAVEEVAQPEEQAEVAEETQVEENTEALPVEEKEEVKEQPKKSLKSLKENLKKKVDKKVKALKEKLGDDEDDDEDEDDNEEDNASDEVIEGLNKKVKLKLEIASPRVQKYYSDFRNELRCYKALKFKSNNTGDTYSYKNKVYVKVTIFAKALKIYFGLDPKEYLATKFHHKDASSVKKYETIPLLIRVSSDRSYKYAINFLNEITKKIEAERVEVKPFDFTTDLKTTSKELLIAQGGESLLVESCSKDACNTISDGLAKKCMMLDLYTPVQGEKKVCEISIGELSAAFNSSYVIDLDLLKKVGLANKDDNYLKVTNKNTCYKAITVKANEFDPEVIKMVVLTGGNIYRLVK